MCSRCTFPAVKYEDLDPGSSSDRHHYRKFAIRTKNTFKSNMDITFKKSQRAGKSSVRMPTIKTITQHIRPSELVEVIIQ